MELDEKDINKVGEDATLDIEVTPSGAFIDSLKRTNKSIKSDRAISISEEAEMAYERYIQDIRMGIKRLKRERTNMLDMSPDNTQSLILAKNFDSKTFVERDLGIAVSLRNEEIRLSLAEKSFEYLFGRKAN